MAVLLLALALSLSGIAIGEYKGKESWGYINVRQDAYMFWWLYYTDVAENYKDYPLVIWLQGGPGAASTGFGNFQEIGPLDVQLNYRNTTWVKKANVLFLDNPVGTGYSYVNNPSALCNNSAQIAEDLVTVLGKFLEHVPEFQKSPLFIISESYGGKMAADFALLLYKTIKAGKIVCNLKGVALGDSWISPIDSVSSWGQYLYTMSMLNKKELVAVNAIVKEIADSIAKGAYKNATELQQKLQNAVGNYTNNVSWYNVLKNTATNDMGDIELMQEEAKNVDSDGAYQVHVGNLHKADLAKLMNGKIREKLHVIPKNVTWSKESKNVYNALAGEFMKPAIAAVDSLLNETGINVIIYSGQLDLICDVLGTKQWMDKLKWPGMKGFYMAPKRVIPLPGKGTAGFVQSFKQLSFFTILKAGHMVPKDAGISALLMLDMILAKGKVAN